MCVCENTHTFKLCVRFPFVVKATEGLCVKLCTLSLSEIHCTCRTVQCVTQFIDTRHALTHTPSIHMPVQREREHKEDEHEKEKKEASPNSKRVKVMSLCVCVHVCEYTLVVALSLSVRHTTLTCPGAARPVGPLGPVTINRPRTFITPLHTHSTTAPLGQHTHIFISFGLAQILKYHGPNYVQNKKKIDIY